MNGSEKRSCNEMKRKERTFLVKENSNSTKHVIMTSGNQTKIINVKTKVMKKGKLFSLWEIIYSLGNYFVNKNGRNV